MLGWPGEVNEGKIVGVMIVDLSTAFDTVISCQVGIIWTWWEFTKLGTKLLWPEKPVCLCRWLSISSSAYCMWGTTGLHIRNSALFISLQSLSWLPSPPLLQIWQFCLLCGRLHLGEQANQKLSQTVEKAHNFLDPPYPRKFWTFLNLGKIRNLT